MRKGEKVKESAEVGKLKTLVPTLLIKQKPPLHELD